MAKPIIDKAEVAIDFPDKFYHGSFGRSSSFDVKVDSDGYHISLDRHGDEHRHVSLHLQHHLFADIIESIAEQISGRHEVSSDDLALLEKALTALANAVHTRTSNLDK